MLKFSEETYETNLSIRYVFEEGINNKDFLVVVFSGFNSPNAEVKHSYNYIRSLRQIDCNKLFILDSYGPRGCYYIGENMSFEVETSVVSLITFIARKLDIKWSNIITAGSSKGGSAALYYGLKYNVGHIICGAPQTLIADYINRVTEETANYMLGTINQSEKAVQLNQIIYKQLSKDVLSKIHLLSSESDSQYKTQVEPFLNTMENLGINFSATIDNKMKSHSDIATHFPSFLVNTLLLIMYDVSIKDRVLKKIYNIWRLYKRPGIKGN